MFGNKIVLPCRGAGTPATEDAFLTTTPGSTPIPNGQADAAYSLQEGQPLRGVDSSTRLQPVPWADLVSVMWGRRTLCALQYRQGVSGRLHRPYSGVVYTLTCAKNRVS